MTVKPMGKPSLVEAFREIGPREDPSSATSPAEGERIRGRNELREKAAARILGELQIAGEYLAREFLGRDHLIEEAIQHTLLRLATRRPGARRSAAEGEPDAEGARVRAYLSTALRHNLVSVLRKEHKHRIREPTVTGETGGPSDGATELRIDLERARVRFFDEVVPEVANGKRDSRAREAFLESVGQLRRLAAGEASFESIVEAELGVPSTDEGEWKRTVNRLDQRYSRALRALDEGLSRFTDEHSLSEIEREHLHLWLDWLRRGPGGSE